MRKLLKDFLTKVKHNSHSFLEPNQSIYISHGQIIAFADAMTSVIDNADCDEKFFDHNFRKELLSWLKLLRAKDITHHKRSHIAAMILERIAYFEYLEDSNKDSSSDEMPF